MAAGKLTELRVLKLEEEAIRKILAEMNDQLNRLKIEELHLKSLQRERDIQAACLLNAKETSLLEQVDREFRQDDINKQTLDLSVPSNFQGSLEMAEEEYDEEELILNL